MARNQSWGRAWGMGLIAALLLAGCESGGRESAAPDSVAPAARAARLEIVQTGLLLTAAGQSRRLQARIFDAQGQQIDRPLSWSSSDPADLQIDDSGLLTAVSGDGSSQIVAQADGVSSPPLLALVASVAPGTVVVEDSQIQRGPQESVPGAEPDFENTYTVILDASQAPALDSLMVGNGSVPLAGRVVNTEILGDGVLVTLRLVSLPELFPTLVINQSLDLSAVPIEIPAEVQADFEISREGELFVFTGRPEAGTTTAKSSRVQGTRAFESACVGLITGVPNGGNAPLPIRVEVPPIFKFSMTPTVDLVYTPSRGLERFLVKARPLFQGEVGFKLTAAFEGKIACKRELFNIPLPIGGPLAFLVGGLIPVGVGLEAGGRITVADVGISDKVEVSTTLEAGLDCQFGSCDFVADLGGPDDSFTVKNTPTFNLPGLDDLRYEPAVELFAYAEAAIGNRFLKSLRFTALEGKFGARLSGSFAPQITQMLATTYKSNYKLSLAAGAKAGVSINSVLQLLGLTSINLFALELTFDLANSPAGTVSADRAEFRSGDVVNFNVKLDPAKLEFLGLDNAGEILLVRNVFNEARIVRRQLVNPGRSEIDFRVTMSNSGRSNEFFAFVVTRLLPLELLSLEIGQATTTGVAIFNRILVEGRAQVSRTRCNSSSGVCENTVIPDTKLDDSLDQTPRSSYDAQTQRTALPSGSGQGTASAILPLDDTGRFSTVALSCEADSNAAISNQSENTIAAGSSNGVISFDVPAATSLAYSIDFPPPRRESRSDSGVVLRGVILVADPDQRLLMPGSDASNPAGNTDTMEQYQLLELVVNLVSRFPFLNQDQRRNDVAALSVSHIPDSDEAAAESGSLSGVLPPGRYSFGLACAALSGGAQSDLGQAETTADASLSLFPVTGGAPPP